MGQNQFIESLRNILKEDNSFAKTADDALIKDFYLKNKKGDDKIDDAFNEYNSDDWMLKQIFPGCIYSFMYNSSSASTYTVNGQTFKFTDTLPVVFVIGNSGDKIQGINLNLCTKELRIIILNLIQNIDPDFFNGGAKKLISEGRAPISTKLLGFCRNPDSAKRQFLQYLELVAKIDYSLIFRTYSISKIKKLQYIEPWQWSRIPFLLYANDMKANILNDIHKANGFSNIKLSL